MLVRWHLYIESGPWFLHNIQVSWQIILEFYIEHSSYTAMLCAQFQNKSQLRNNKLQENMISWDLSLSFRGHPILQQHPGSLIKAWIKLHQGLFLKLAPLIWCNFPFSLHFIAMGLQSWSKNIVMDDILSDSLMRNRFASLDGVNIGSCTISQFVK